MVQGFKGFSTETKYAVGWFEGVYLYLGATERVVDSRFLKRPRRELRSGSSERALRLLRLAERLDSASAKLHPADNRRLDWHPASRASKVPRNESDDMQAFPPRLAPCQKHRHFDGTLRTSDRIPPGRPTWPSISQDSRRLSSVEPEPFKQRVPLFSACQPQSQYG